MVDFRFKRGFTPTPNFGVSLQSKRGFTLIELLVVIAIIGLLASIVLVSLNNARAKARDTRRVADFRQIAIGLEQYNDTNSGYPSVSTNTCTQANFSGASGAGTTLVTAGYLPSLPADPLNNATYYYAYSGNVLSGVGLSTDYVLRVVLETYYKTALDFDMDGTSPFGNCVCGTAGATDREYCLSP